MLIMLKYGSLLMCATAVTSKEYSEAVAWGLTTMAFFAQSLQQESIEASQKLIAMQVKLITRLQKTIDDHIEKQIEAPVAQEEERR